MSGASRVGDLQPFRQVMIPITDERFLTSGFRFRFRNRASLSRNNDYPDMRSNVDYWHVDYVRLGPKQVCGGYRAPGCGL